MVALITGMAMTALNAVSPGLSGQQTANGGKGTNMGSKTETIILGGGCFWCVEAAYELVPGVVKTTVGYAGGSSQFPTYEQVCAGGTAFIEVVKLEFDPSLTTLEKILDMFWKIHDPTSLDRQGADAGYQYHSIIMWETSEQKTRAEAVIKAIQSRYDRHIVTEIRQASRFWQAEDYHQDYFRKNPNAGYCQVVIAPKLQHAGLLK